MLEITASFPELGYEEDCSDAGLDAVIRWVEYSVWIRCIVREDGDVDEIDVDAGQYGDGRTPWW